MEEQNSNDLKRIFNIVELPTQQYLQECFEHDNEDGKLYWNIRPLHHFDDNERIMEGFNTQFGGKVVGRIDKAGYYRTKIKNTNPAVHRIIWKMYRGEDPKYFIDHINGNRSDNRIENLRDIPHGHNTINLNGLKENNNTGYTGVSKVRSGRYRSYTNVDGKQKIIGTYNTPEEAALSYQLKILEVYGEEFYYANEKNKILLEELKIKVEEISKQIFKVNMIRSTNKSGYVGVSYIKANNKWYACITVDKKTKNLGVYNTPEEASLVREKAYKNLIGEDKYTEMGRDDFLLEIEEKVNLILKERETNNGK